MGGSPRGSAETFKARADKRYKEKDYAGALEGYSRALELTPTSTLYNNRAAAHMMMKRCVAQGGGACGGGAGARRGASSRRLRQSPERARG